jgi:hypothetical protein
MTLSAGPRTLATAVIMARTSELVGLEALFDHFSADLKAEAEAIAKIQRLSARQRQRRYLQHVKKYDAARLRLQNPPFDSTDRADARIQIYRLIEEILEDVGSTRSVSLVPTPSRAAPTLPITVAGGIAGPEFPDRPSDDDPEGLTEWNRQIAAYAPVYALRYEITEPIYRSHGLFESAMPQDSLDRLIFRTPADQQWMRETRRNNLVIHAEILIRKYAAERLQNTAPTNAATPSAPNAQAALDESVTSTDEGASSTEEKVTPSEGKANSVEERSRRRLSKIAPALKLLGWSRNDWANATAEHNKGNAVAYTTISRYLNGITKTLRVSGEPLLRIALREALLKSPEPGATRLAKKLAKALPA